MKILLFLTAHKNGGLKDITKNNSAIGFFVDDNPELFKAWDAKELKRE